MFGFYYLLQETILINVMLRQIKNTPRQLFLVSFSLGLLSVASLCGHFCHFLLDDGLRLEDTTRLEIKS